MIVTALIGVCRKHQPWNGKTWFTQERFGSLRSSCLSSSASFMILGSPCVRSSQRASEEADWDGEKGS